MAQLGRTLVRWTSLRAFMIKLPTLPLYTQATDVILPIMVNSLVQLMVQIAPRPRVPMEDAGLVRLTPKHMALALTTSMVVSMPRRSTLMQSLFGSSHVPVFRRILLLAVLTQITGLHLWPSSRATATLPRILRTRRLYVSCSGDQLLMFTSITNRKNSQILNTSFCGTWASNAWASNSGCASKADTCNAYVQNYPADFADAYWSLNYIRVYQDS